MKVIVSKPWIDDLSGEIADLRDWLTDGRNIDDCLEALAEILVEKHHDYGEENLAAFGELGILVRASDKVARLKNLVTQDAAVKNESREDTWRDLAGYALQALIMLRHMTDDERRGIYEIRKNRLNAGLCPDCGKGALLRRQKWTDLQFVVYCSDACGFHAGVDMFDAEGDLSRAIEKLARMKAIQEQK